MSPSNRPRPSILAQFDPLLSETEPEYVSDSEEENPDKENMVPELGLTEFFSRTYKHEYAQPATLTKRLIDIGDATIVDIVDEEEEKEGNGENIFFSLETPKRALPGSIPRTPLAEISLEPKPRHSPLGRVVETLPRSANTVNSAGTSFGHPERAPRITVNNADNNLVGSLMATTAPFDLQASTLSQQDASDNRLAPPNASTSNRLSLDLHSSFSLQSETSFDLLNDRISFFEAQGHAFLNALDDDIAAPDTSFDDNDDTTPTALPELDSLSTITYPLKNFSLSSEGDSSLPLVFGPLIGHSTSTVTPAVHRTAATTVPALRIIKRIKRYDDERPAASSSSHTVHNAPQRKSSSVIATSEVPISKTSSKPLGQHGFPAALFVEDLTSTTIATSKPSKLSGASGPKRVLNTDPCRSSKTAGRHKVPLPILPSMNVKSASSAIPSGVPRSVGTSGIPASRLPAPSGIARFGRKASAPPASVEAPGSGGSRTAPVRSAARRYLTYGPQ